MKTLARICFFFLAAGAGIAQVPDLLSYYCAPFSACNAVTSGTNFRISMSTYGSCSNNFSPSVGVTIQALQCSQSVTTTMGGGGFPTFGSLVGYVEANGVSATVYATYNDSGITDCYGNRSSTGSGIGFC